MISKDEESGKYFINEEIAIKVCTKLATNIEAIVYFSNKQKTDPTYKKKLSSLVFNLNNSENDELRAKVLSSEIPPDKLSKMSVEELAPSKLKKTRNELQNKYIQEQVIKKDEIKLIAKNHKGESIITIEQDESNADLENLSKLNEKNIYNKALDIEEDMESNLERNNDLLLEPSIYKRESNALLNSSNHNFALGHFNSTTTANKNSFGGISKQASSVLQNNNSERESNNGASNANDDIESSNKEHRLKENTNFNSVIIGNKNSYTFNSNNQTTKTKTIVIDNNRGTVISEFASDFNHPSSYLKGDFIGGESNTILDNSEIENEIIKMIKSFHSVEDLKKLFEESISVLNEDTQKEIQEKRKLLLEKGIHPID